MMDEARFLRRFCQECMALVVYLVSILVFDDFLSIVIVIFLYIHKIPVSKLSDEKNVKWHGWPGGGLKNVLKLVN